MAMTAPTSIPRVLSFEDPKDRLRNLWAGLLGVFFAACMVKFGNPVILDDPAVAMKGLAPLLDPDPSTNNRYFGLLAIAGLGLGLSRKPKGIPAWAWVLAAGWFVWQWVAASQTIDSALTQATMKHFIGCAACFSVGILVLGAVRDPRYFLAGLLVGFVFTLVVAWQQHFTGLEAMRRYFYLYTLPKLENPPAELIKRIESRRVFGTFVYANALAGCILLLLPVLLTFVRDGLWRERRGLAASLAVLLGIMAGAALMWTGSKSGWLIALVMVGVVLLRMGIPRRIKILLVVVFFAGGVGAFFLRFEDYFSKGATSVGARFQYWAAARGAFLERPLVGTGPGTFGVVYRRVKPPEAEMAQLTHNDYLEQASDSGVVGCVCFAGLWLGSVLALFRSAWKDQLAFGLWLGLLGWALQGFVEFGLYIPGTAWPAFTLLGWLWSANRVDTISTRS